MLLQMSRASCCPMGPRVPGIARTEDKAPLPHFIIPTHTPSGMQASIGGALHRPLSFSSFRQSRCTPRYGSCSSAKAGLRVASTNWPTVIFAEPEALVIQSFDTSGLGAKMQGAGKGGCWKEDSVSCTERGSQARDVACIPGNRLPHNCLCCCPPSCPAIGMARQQCSRPPLPHFPKCALDDAHTFP